MRHRSERREHPRFTLVRRHIWALRWIPVGMMLTLAGMIGTTIAMAQSGPDALGQGLSILQMVLGISTGVMLLFEIALFRLYQKLNDDVGPLLKAVELIQRWKESEAGPQLATVDQRDTSSRHHVSQDITHKLMQMEDRQNERINRLEDQRIAKLEERVEYVVRAIIERGQE